MREADRNRPTGDSPGSAAVPRRGPLRIALAGCGGVARQYHLRALRSDPRAGLVAVADPSPAARAAVGRLAGTAVFDDPLAAIAEPSVEAVVICAATPAHEELARATLARGLHLYLEKPIALDRDGADAIAAIAAGSDRTCAIGFNYRLNPAFARLRKRAVAGEIGNVRSVRCSFCEPVAAPRLAGWRSSRSTGGGVVLDLASHEVDTLRWLLGEEIVAVESAEIRSIASPCDEAVFALRTASGIPVAGRVSHSSGREHRWQLEGERGSLRLDRWPARVSARGRGWTAALETRLRDSRMPRREPSFALAMRAFTRAALGEPHALPTLTDGARSLNAVLAIERAADSGRPVELSGEVLRRELGGG